MYSVGSREQSRLWEEQAEVRARPASRLVGRGASAGGGGRQSRGHEALTWGEDTREEET